MILKLLLLTYNIYGWYKIVNDIRKRRVRRLGKKLLVSML